MQRIVANIVIFLSIIFAASAAYAVEHDHQPWNMVGVGRLVAIARINEQQKGDVRERTTAAADEAMARLNDVIDSFECRSLTGRAKPTISTFEALSKYDKGPVVFAEVRDVTCELSPRRQLFPIEPQEFGGICSQLDWKCDVVWISDGDPAVWHINRWSDIPPHSP